MPEGLSPFPNSSLQELGDRQGFSLCYQDKNCYHCCHLHGSLPVVFFRMSSGGFENSCPGESPSRLMPVQGRLGGSSSPDSSGEPEGLVVSSGVIKTRIELLQFRRLQPLLSHGTLFRLIDSIELLFVSFIPTSSSLYSDPNILDTNSPLRGSSDQHSTTIPVAAALVVVVPAAVQVAVGPVATISQQGILWACTPRNGRFCCSTDRVSCRVPSRQEWTSPSSPVVPVCAEHFPCCCHVQWLPVWRFPPFRFLGLP